MKSDPQNKLKHISFIMDGNGRWAKKRGLPRNAGHKAGVEKAKEIVIAVKEMGIPFISMYTFSKENWIRPKNEVSFLMDLIVMHLKKDFDFYIRNKIKIIHIGDRKGLPQKVLDAIDRVQKETWGFDSITLLLALNYSGKYDIVQSVNRFLRSGKLKATENDIQEGLATAGYPDPDLIVRTSGEFRISNYFLWQSAYSEFYISGSLWPEFKKEELNKIVEEYYYRERRFGGIKNE